MYIILFHEYYNIKECIVMRYAEETKTEELMKRYGYPKFQKQVFRNICDFISITLKIDVVTDIDKEYYNSDKHIKWIIADEYSSYEISVKPGCIFLTYKEKSVRYEGKRNPSKDIPLWELYMFTSKKYYEFNQSFFNIINTGAYYARKSECKESARTLLMYAVRDFEYIRDKDINKIIDG